MSMNNAYELLAQGQIDYGYQLFNFAPVSLWESDLSKVKNYLSEPWAEGIDNMADYITQHPERLEQCISGAQLITVNQATLDLCKAADKEALINALPTIYTKKGLLAFLSSLTAIHQDKTKHCFRGEIQDLQGETHLVDVIWQCMPGYECSFARVMFVLNKVTTKANMPTKDQWCGPDIEMIENARFDENLALLRSYRHKILQRSTEMLENTLNMVAHIDLQGRFLYLNQVGRSLLGLDDNKDARCYNLKQFYSDIFRKNFTDEILPALMDKGGWMGRAEVLTLAGKVIPVSQKMAVHRDIKGQVESISVTIRDLTVALETEQTLLHYQQELADVYRHHSMSEVASSIAHEVNQPLTIIANYASGCLHRLQQGKINSADLTKSMTTITEQATQAGQILQQAKNYLAHGELKLEKLDIHSVINESIELAKSWISLPSLRAILDYAPDIPHVAIDCVYMQQVFTNLIRNAARAMQKCSPSKRKITIKTRLNDEQTLEILVSDVGAGMSKEQCEKVFQPLFRSKDQGVGLALVRYIIEQHKGYITVDSVLGKGTQFKIVLPID